MSNTITAFFKGRVGVAEAVYQNDYGIVMNFDSIDLPAHFDCYFSVTGEDEAIPGVGADRQVVIPNSCLSKSGTVTLHIPIHTGSNDSEVEYVVYFKVIGRARPIDDGTPAQMTAIEQALALLQNPIGNIEQIVNEALAFTGDTFAEMQEQLDADQAAYESNMSSRASSFEAEIRNNIVDVESDFSNLNAQFQTAIGAVTVDDELLNVRVGDDNVTYATAGEAVRKQFAGVKSKHSAAEIGFDISVVKSTSDSGQNWGSVKIDSFCYQGQMLNVINNGSTAVNINLKNSSGTTIQSMVVSAGATKALSVSVIPDHIDVYADEFPINVRIQGQSFSDYIAENGASFALESYDISWEVGKTLNDSTGLPSNNSWTAITTPIGEDIDVLFLEDSSGGHLWYNIIGYDDSWAHKGMWNPITKAFVKSEVQIRNAVFFMSMIKQLYPNYHFCLKLVKDNGGMSDAYTNDIKAYAIKDKILEKQKGSTITWASGQLNAATGQLQSHANAISTVEYIPDEVKIFIGTTNGRIHVWNSDDTYAGTFFYNQVLSNYSSQYGRVWDLDAIRTVLPGCKLKITVYDVNSDPTAASNFVLLRNAIEYLQAKGSEVDSREYYTVPTGFSLTSVYQKSLDTNHRWQGFGTDGTYLYVAELTDSTAEETAETIIHKINPTNGTVVASSSGLVLGHANSIGYDPAHNYLLVAYTKPSNPYLLYRINADDLSLVDTIDLKSLLQATGSGDTNPSGVGYIEEINGFVLYTTSHYVVVDGEFQNVLRIIKTIKPSTYLGQSLFVKDNMLVQVYADSSNWNNMVVVYDWHGNHIKTINMGLTNGELQGLVYIGDTPYLCYEASSCAIYRGQEATESVPVAYVQKQFNLND